MKRGVLAFLIAAFCFLSTASAQDRAGQAGGARGGRGGAPPVAVERKLPPKPKPVGAWWYTGETPPPMQDAPSIIPKTRTRGAFLPDRRE